MAKANPVTDKAPETTPEVPKTDKASPSKNPLDAFKTELPNGLTIHNFVKAPN